MELQRSCGVSRGRWMSKSEHGAFRFIFAGCQVGFHFVRLGSVEGVERRTGKFGGLVSFPKICAFA